jgi:DNA-binding transcriptional LysR family regulator
LAARRRISTFANAATVPLQGGPRADALHDRPPANVDRAVAGMRAAAAQGAGVVCLPELFRTQYLCQRGDHGSLFVRGLALAHLDATLGRRTKAARFLRDDVERAFAAKGIPVESMRAEPCNKIDTPRTDG